MNIELKTCELLGFECLTAFRTSYSIEGRTAQYNQQLFFFTEKDVNLL